MIERKQGADIENGPLVYLSGEFKTPRPWRIPTGVTPTLVNVILSSGGVTDKADLSRVKVMRIAATFGARKLKSDGGNEASDERVVEVVVSADNTPFLIGQRVLVKFMKPGEKAGIKRDVPKSVTPAK